MSAGIFDVPQSYSGLLDDVVDRYRITEEVDDAFFKRSIIRNVFFSGEILINDGYLVNHPHALPQVLDEDSLLRVMVKNRFVKVLARSQNPEAFASNPEVMAAKQIRTFQELVSRPDWRSIKQDLEHWSEGLFAGNMVEGWPKYQIHAGFRKLFEAALSQQPEAVGLGQLTKSVLEDFAARYLDHASYEEGPRTAVEEVAKEMRDQGVITNSDLLDIMNMANQCYHYNFAMCMSAERETPVVADTSIGPAFQHILQLDNAIEQGLDDVPVLAIPKGFPIDNGAIFDRLLDHQSKLCRAKHEFLYRVTAVYSGQDGFRREGAVKDLKEAVLEYRRLLAEHFSGLVGAVDFAPRRYAMITFGFGRLGSAVGADLGVLAANLVSTRGVSSFVHKLTRPIRRRMLEIALDPDAGETKMIEFTAKEIRPRFASLAFNTAAVEAHTADLPSIP
ncbi:hypothetical protein [Maricaulis sp.]|uniref:hypothetical protein n=1 Tax=Maricaulis sp. TaxID=1486257 RepID=UPI0025BF4BFA|nr:hypothetical protein [Maricaulis sp.]